MRKSKPDFNRKRAPIRPVSSEVDFGLKPKAKAASVFNKFGEIWTNLFTSPIHLDSALSKLPSSVKTILAQIIPAILLRPASLAEALGVGMMEGEPWSLDNKSISTWRPARLMAERIYETMSQGLPETTPIQEDFPPWMVSEWKSSWGDKVVLDLLEALSSEAPLSLRASRRFGADALLKGLTEGRRLPVQAKLSDLSPFGVRLSGYAPVLGTEWYEKGAFEIQDEGSQVMALFCVVAGAFWVASFEPSWQSRQVEAFPFRATHHSSGQTRGQIGGQMSTLIDACAGAGGKSLAMADALKGKGRVFAYDTSAKKLQALSRRMVRAGLNNIQTVMVQEGNESEVTDRFKGTGQVVLVDAPCSGWGVLRRNPDIKWRQTQEALQRMPQIQLRLLSQYSTLVAPEGRLVFGVCTFRLPETRDVVASFLKENPQFEAREGGYLGPGPCDGFFMQSFVKKG